jgi:hypothetical protein
MARKAKTASKPKEVRLRRKLITFDEESWQALEVLARDQMKSWEELADEAIRDLLKKHGRSADLRTALKLSIKPDDKDEKAGTRRKRRH